MADLKKGTDTEILGSIPVKKDERKGRRGRKKFNRDLMRLLLEAGKSAVDVADHMGCNARIVRDYRKELVAAGVLDQDKKGKNGIVESTFDKECISARGMTYLQFLKKDWKTPSTPYNKAKTYWEGIWEMPSLHRMMNEKDPLAEELAIIWDDHFGEDKGRRRYRKKLIRPFFRFVKRYDIEKEWFSMDNQSDPRNIRKIPAIGFSNFPKDLQEAINEFERIYGKLAGTWLRTKICLQGRTGNRKEERGMLGLSKDSRKKSWLVFHGSADRFTGNVFEKMGQDWPITWIPKDIRQELYEIFENGESEFYFPWSRKKKGELSKAWRVISKEYTGEELTFHDMRKVSATWFFAAGVPVESAVNLNIGWSDYSTAITHYFEMRNLLKKSERAAYLANIPEWFLDELDEYRREEYWLNLPRPQGGPPGRANHPGGR